MARKMKSITKMSGKEIAKTLANRYGVQMASRFALERANKQTDPERKAAYKTARRILEAKWNATKKTGADIDLVYKEARRYCNALYAASGRVQRFETLLGSSIRDGKKAKVAFVKLCRDIRKIIK